MTGKNQNIPSREKCVGKGQFSVNLKTPIGYFEINYPLGS